MAAPVMDELRMSLMQMDKPERTGGGMESEDDGGVSGRVLVVDDDRMTRTAHRSVLARKFDVLTAASGEEALDLCRAQLPDVVLLDVGMPGLDGYETCRQLREWADIPILFVTAHQCFEEHLKAYEAGGNDLITKPVNADILIRKVGVAIRQHQAALALAQEKAVLERMAMGFLSGATQNGILLNFMRSSMVCQDYQALATQLMGATRDLGLSCCAVIHHAGGRAAMTEHGEPTPLEMSILDYAQEMGRVFQFKRRLVVNYERASIIVADMPDEVAEPERAGALRDSLVILAETAEALAINVDMRLEARQRAEQLQVAMSSAEQALMVLGEKNRVMQMDCRLLLQELADGIERSYSWLNTSSTQEASISGAMENAIQRVLERMSRSGDFEAQFDQIMTALSTGRGDVGVELF